jgi:hypothetical protein
VTEKITPLIIDETTVEKVIEIMTIETKEPTINETTHVVEEIHISIP